MGLALLVLVTAGFYAPTLRYGYVYEDLNDPHTFLRGWTEFVRDDLSGRDPNHGDGLPHLSLRQMLKPRVLTAASFAASHSLAGTPSVVDHGVNVAIHLLNICLLALLVWNASGLAFWLTVAMFALHPLQSETVAYVSSRPDLLVATGLLIALIGVDRASWRLLAFGSLVATFSKEIGVMVWLVSLIAWCVCVRRPVAAAQGRSAAWQWRPVWLSGVLLLAFGLVVTVSAMPPSHGFMQRPIVDVRGALALINDQTIFVVTRQLVEVWRLLLYAVWPSGLSIVHDWRWITPSIGIVACVATSVVAWLCARGYHAAWLVAGVFLLLLPRILLNDHQPLHEHHLYSGMAFVSMAFITVPL